MWREPLSVMPNSRHASVLYLDRVLWITFLEEEFWGAECSEDKFVFASSVFIVVCNSKLACLCYFLAMVDVRSTENQNTFVAGKGEFDP